MSSRNPFPKNFNNSIFLLRHFFQIELRNTTSSFRPNMECCWWLALFSCPKRLRGFALFSHLKLEFFNWGMISIVFLPSNWGTYSLERFHNIFGWIPLAQQLRLFSFSAVRHLSSHCFQHLPIHHFFAYGSISRSLEEKQFDGLCWIRNGINFWWSLFPLRAISFSIILFVTVLAETKMWSVQFSDNNLTNQTFIKFCAKHSHGEMIKPKNNSHMFNTITSWRQIKSYDVNVLSLVASSVTCSPLNEMKHNETFSPVSKEVA